MCVIIKTQRCNGKQTWYYQWITFSLDIKQRTIETCSPTLHGFALRGRLEGPDNRPSMKIDMKQSG